MSFEELEYVADVSAWDSGGGTTIDNVWLKDGRVLAISEEVVVLYKSIDDLESGEAADRPMLPL